MPDRARSAREARSAKASALADLRNHRITIVDVLHDVPVALRSAHIYGVLCACPAVGPKKAERLLQANMIWPLRPMHALTIAEREALLRDLPDKTKEDR